MKKRILSILLFILLLSVILLQQTHAGQTVYDVRKDGDGDFDTIQAAVDNAPQNSVIRIHEGIYEENVIIRDKTINLIGTDKKTCILTSPNDYYHQIPLEIGAGSVENLTIYGYTDKTRSDDWISRPFYADPDYLIRFNNDTDRETASKYEGYTIHIDQDYSENKSLSFKNCHIISENSCCIGCGLKNGFNLLFTDCAFTACASGGCVFLHDSADTNYTGKCSANFTNCNFTNYSSIYFFTAYSLNNENHVDLTFTNNSIHTVVYANSQAYTANKYTGPSISETIPAADLDPLETLYFRNAVLASKPLYKTPCLAEGITILRTSETIQDTAYGFPMCITNFCEGNGDGWCGTNTFFLTPDSYGNTLKQMNY